MTALERGALGAAEAGCPGDVPPLKQLNTLKLLALSRNRQRPRLKPNSLEKAVYPFQAAYPFLEEKGRMKCGLLQARSSLGRAAAGAVVSPETLCSAV